MGSKTLGVNFIIILVYYNRKLLCWAAVQLNRVKGDKVESRDDIYSAINGHDENYARGELFLIWRTPGWRFLLACELAKLSDRQRMRHRIATTTRATSFFFFSSFGWFYISSWDYNDRKRKKNHVMWFFYDRLSVEKRIDLSIIIARNIIRSFSLCESGFNH